MTGGRKLPVAAESELGRTEIKDRQIKFKFRRYGAFNLIILGNCKLIQRLGIATEESGAEGIRIQTGKNYLAVTGKDVGVQHAAVTLLEYLGVRYLWPGESGKVVPKKKNIAVSLNVRKTPLVQQRRIRSLSSNSRMDVGLRKLALTPRQNLVIRRKAYQTVATSPSWFAWQKLTGSVDVVYGHAFGDAWEKYGKEHPEWFAVQPDGSRDQSRSPDRSRFCHSNRELPIRIARDIIKTFDENPNKRSASLGLNDGGQTTFCMCGPCKAMDPPEGPKIKMYRYGEHVSLSDRVVTFTNRIAEEVSKKYPKALFGYYAYSSYTSPPVRTKLHPNLVVAYVGVHYINEDYRRKCLAEWDTWSEKVSRLVFRPNLLLAARRSTIALNYVHRMAEDFKHFAETGMVGTDFDSCTHDWSLLGLNYYVLAKLHWDPHLDVDAVVDDYCKAGFGSGAKSVRSYFDRIGRITDAFAAGKFSIGTQYTPKVLDELNALLESAEALTRDQPDCNARVKFLQIGLEFTRLQAEAHTLLGKVKSGEKVDMAKAREVLDERYHFMRRNSLEAPLSVNFANLCWGDWANWRPFKWSRPELPREDPELIEVDIEFE